MGKVYTETGIIQGLKNNDEQVYNFLFKCYFAELSFFAWRFIRDEKESEDITIQIFNKFWNQREKLEFESVNKIRSFLHVAIRNKCLDYLDSQASLEARKKGYFDYIKQQQAGQDIELEFINADLMRQVWQKAEELPEKCKQVFKLTYIHGMGINEIAELLNISHSNVTSQQSRAIVLLRKMLRDNPLVLIFFRLLIEHWKN